MSSLKAVSKGRWYSSICVFLLGALCLVISSGYTYGPALLLLAALPFLFYKSAWPRVNRADAFIAGALVFFMLLWVAEVVLSGAGSREFDKPSRFLVGVIVLFWLLKYPPKLAFLWSGIAVGALGAGVFALFERFVEGAPRAQGYTHSIQYGNISMLLGVLCVAGLGWALDQKCKLFWSALLLVGFVAGFVGSMLSGSRGGWVGLPFIALVLYRCYRPWMKPRYLSIAAMVAVALLVFIYSVPQTGVQARVKQAFGDIEHYLDGNSATSVGGRFEMWRGASLMIAEKPLTGWGEPGYQSKMAALAEQGEVPEFILMFEHAHNEYLDVFAKRGILGLVALLLLYFGPLRLFLKRTSGDDLAVSSLAAGGAALCVAYIDFSLSQSFLSHNSGVMVFVFFLVVFWATLQNRLRLRGSAQ